jgi:hypothetical protein
MEGRIIIHISETGAVNNNKTRYTTGNKTKMGVKLIGNEGRTQKRSKTSGAITMSSLYRVPKKNKPGCPQLQYYT